MEFKGTQGVVTFDGDWVSIAQGSAITRFRAASVKRTRFKSATTFIDGYVQFEVPSTLVSQDGHSGRSTAPGQHRVAFRKAANAEAAQLVAEVEQARS